MESPARQISLVPPLDRRQSETALAIARGTARLLRSLGFSCISELPLPSGRRADLVALNEKGEIWIVEIKSSVEDLRADQKWQDYRMHCDRLFFAFTQDLPCEIFPQDTGLIIADAYGAHLHCEAPEHRLPAATRKSMTVRFAMAAAQRINRLVDPQGHGGVLRDGAVGWAKRSVPTISPRSLSRMVGTLRFAHPTKLRELPRRALRENPLQGAAVHVEPPRGLGDVAVAHLVDALDVFPAHAIRRHRI